MEWPIVVVDIGRLDEAGNPWDRATSARLLRQIAGAGPRLVAADIVFSGDCGAGPVNQVLAEAVNAGPTVLGALISREAGPASTASPHLADSQDIAGQLRAAPGLQAPCVGFQGPVVGLGIVSLPADSGAMVRHVPAGVLAGGAAHPSLPVEVLRRIDGAATALIGVDPEGGAALRLGGRVFALEAGGMLRFVPSRPKVWAGRTVAATEVLNGLMDARLRGAAVLIGSSVPQRGGLRPTASDGLHPSVQIAADMLGGLSAGTVPHRTGRAAAVEAGVLLAMVAAVMAALLRAPSSWVLAGTGGLALAAGGASAAVNRGTGILYDPSLPVLGLLAASVAALAYQAAGLWRADAALRRRMGQTLPPSVVTRVAQTPGLLRVSGEAREVATLFTDLEGFSDLVNRAAPELVIGHLDAYFGLLTEIILRPWTWPTRSMPP